MRIIRLHKVLKMAGAVTCLLFALNLSCASEASPVEKIVAEAQVLAEQGDVESMRMLWRHFDGAGNVVDATKWGEFLFATLAARAEVGDATAMVELGRLFQLGSKLYPRNLETAYLWYERAGRLGNAEAQYHLGFLTSKGMGCKADESMAQEWYAKAKESLLPKAESGDVLALVWLGTLEESGMAGMADYEQATRWLTLAAEKGDLRAISLMGFKCYEGRGVPQDDAAGTSWFLKAAEAGDVGAIMEVVRAYQAGRGVEKSNAKAREWLRRGVDKGDAFSQYFLAEELETSSGNAEQKEAASLYERAAVQGLPVAALGYAAMFARGVFTKPTYEEARAETEQLLLTAAEKQGHLPAALALAQFYEQIDNPNQSYIWLSSAARNGDTQAMEILGDWHLDPTRKGLKWNPVAAYQWWQFAAERGSGQAMEKARWLLWGGSFALLAILVPLLFWLNVTIKRKFAREAQLQSECPKQ